MDLFFPSKPNVSSPTSRMVAACGCSPFRWREWFDPGDFSSRQAGKQIF
jgi:hypothetical protein